MAKQKMEKAPGLPRHFIKQWREYRHLSQERLADRIGVSRGAISQLETGITGYTQGMLEALADALAVEPADLLQSDPKIDDALHQIWKNLEAPAREQAIRILKALAKAA
jgi:transcriptional regulator with XRE-family HTH domain